MKAITLFYPIFAILLMAISARADDDVNIERMATCQDSWFELKNKPSEFRRFGEDIRSRFIQKAKYEYLVPKSDVSVFGLRVVGLFPESVGMGVGFSVIVEADFKKTRESLGKSLRESFEACEKDENAVACELSKNKTLILFTEERGNKANTLIGCYYYYEK